MKQVFKADFLNKHCHCRTLDAARLVSTLASPADNSATGIYFSESPHFLSRKDLQNINQFISAHERLVKSPGFSKAVLQQNQAFAGLFPDQKNLATVTENFREHGIFNSYDFHITPNGPKLIEVNSNAAGGVLSLLAQQQAINCCVKFGSYKPDGRFLFSEKKIVDMLRSEFSRYNSAEPLQTLAIVDENPASQYFYGEFIALQSLLEKNHIRVFIGDPASLVIRENKVFLHNQHIQLIYNRSTDFYFTKDSSKVLKEIFLNHLAAVSPTPLVHALYASKQNLAYVYSSEIQAEANLTPEQIQFLRLFIPETQFVTPENSAKFWETRREWFFKPFDSYAGKGAFKGEKITRKVFEEIQKGNYLAQRFIAPGRRRVSADLTMKYDIRAYTYTGQIQGLVARYYCGQTTNFRTAQGGLASVFIAA